MLHGGTGIARSIKIRQGSTTALEIATDGTLWIGSIKDTNLYRSAANTLKTDDTLIVGAKVVISNLTGAGNAYACLNQNGTLYRSGTACT